jgi:hemerythrin
MRMNSVYRPDREAKVCEDTVDISRMFEWSDDYSVQVVSIDAQHRNLFAIAHELYDAMSAGQGRMACGKILDRLVQYTAVHFAFEERLMRSNNYDELTAHKAEHDVLTAQVVQFQSDYQRGTATLSVELLHFLKGWLEKHIKGSDVRYVPCLTRRELQTAGVRFQR